MTRSIWAVTYHTEDGTQIAGYGPCSIPILCETRREAEAAARSLDAQCKGYLIHTPRRVRVHVALT